MKKTIFIFILCMGGILSFGSPPERNLVSKKELNLYRESFYVHTDKPYYYQGEPMWFTIYANYTSAEIKQALSGPVYVEFISAQKQILLRRTYFLENGIAWGHWRLPDSLQTRNYFLRIYTHLSRNFGDSALFIRQIPVLQIHQKPSKMAEKKQEVSPLMRISASQKTFTKREKISLTIEVLDSLSQSANVSIAITDINQVLPIPQEANIMQGYTLPPNSDSVGLQEFLYPSETGIGFAGIYTNKKKPQKAEFYLVDAKNQLSAFAESDTSGHFAVEGLQFYDTANFIIQPFGKEKITNGKIIFTPRNIPNFFYNISEPVNSEPVNTETQKIMEPNIEIETTDKRQRIFSEYEIPKGVLILKEIKVEDRKIDERQKLADKVLSASTYTTRGNLPDYIIPREKIKTQYPNILYSLQGIPGVGVNARDGIVEIIRARSSSILFQKYPLIMVDDVPVHYDPDPEKGGMNIFQIINPNDVEMITISKRINTLYGSQGAFGVISIYLKKGPDYDTTRTYQTLEYVKVAGYSSARKFEAPNYGDAKTDKGIPDFRSTLYWNPNLNIEGKASISFFAADLITTYRVVVEGVTKDNKPIRGEYYIEVK